jgi:hypothetical protein
MIQHQEIRDTPFGQPGWCLGAGGVGLNLTFYILQLPF